MNEELGAARQEVPIGVVREVDYHRNGVGGVGFYVAIVDGYEEVGEPILYVEMSGDLADGVPVAVLRLSDIASGNVYMHRDGDRHPGGAAWRGDNIHGGLHDLVMAAYKEKQRQWYGG